jgi:hypothetical protein
MLVELADEILDVAEATPETEEENVTDVIEVDEIEVGIMTADELEIELAELKEMSVDVVLELETTD